jgi:hypothetical protein
MPALGHSLPMHSAPVSNNVRLAPKATKSRTCRECREVAQANIRPTIAFGIKLKEAAN